MGVYISNHALRRCRQQDIDIWAVRFAIVKAPNTAGERNRWKMPGGHMVIYVRNGTDAHVITVIGRRKMKRGKRRKRERL